MSDAIINQNQNSAVFNDLQARANSFAGYAAIAALAPNLAAKGAEIQAAAVQDLQATEPRLVGTNMSMSNNYFADYSAIAAFAAAVNAKNAKIQAAEQDLTATEPQVVVAYEPMSKNSLAEQGALAAFAANLAFENKQAAAVKHEEQAAVEYVIRKPSFFQKLMNMPITYAFRPNFGGAV